MGVLQGVDCTWLYEIWQEFPTDIVRNAFRGCGYAFEEGIEYSYDTESESEISDGE